MGDHPAIDQIYAALIRMTHQLHRAGPGLPPERPGEALFEGSGNPWPIGPTIRKSRRARVSRIKCQSYWNAQEAQS